MFFYILHFLPITYFSTHDDMVNFTKSFLPEDGPSKNFFLISMVFRVKKVWIDKGCFPTTDSIFYWLNGQIRVTLKIRFDRYRQCGYRYLPSKMFKIQPYKYSFKSKDLLCLQKSFRHL